MRLIDANKLKKHPLIPLGVIHLIDSQPTIDAEPVVHAHWIKDKNFIDGEYIMRICSNCKNEMFGQLLPPNYCSNCGAKMDEEVK